jgi:large conductance mechanosensitive channel
MLEGFTKFLVRGNVVDLAVGIIIGASFKSIVDKFTEAIINPMLGFVVGKQSFDDALIFGPFKIGMVITAVLNFVMTAAVIYFVFVVPMNHLRERLDFGDKKPPPPAEPTPSEKLLMEIRDAIRGRKVIE